VNFRNAIKAIFGGIKNYATTVWKEVGGYTARFSSFGTNVYANEVVRACIRTLAEHTSKANVKVLRNGLAGDKRLQRMIQYRPNVYMNGKDFLYKVRTLLEINNVVFIYIMRDDLGKCVGLYPMPATQYEAVESGGELYIKFYYPNSTMVHAWDDLAVLRKDYNTSDIWGDTNDAILTSLELLTTTSEGMANAIRSTANLRGILKTTKAMLSPDDAKKQKDRFVEDYMGLTNSSGIAMLDATQSFEPITIQPQIANYKSVEELRNNIYRYFGVNEEAILSKLSGDSWDAFYEARIEPVLIALGLELTNKIFSQRERGFENEIIFESNRMQYMSTANKLALTNFVDRAIMTPNEVREVLNLAPVPWGDKPMSWQNPKMCENEGTEASDDNEGQTV